MTGPSVADLPQLLQRAMLAQQGGKLDEAEQAYLRVLQVQPGNPDALHLLGVLRSQQGRHEEALTLLTSAVENRPSDAPAHTNRGLVLRRLNRNREALASFDKALEIDPNHWMTLINRANVLLALGEPEQALASVDRGSSLAPNIALGHAGRGDALVALHRFAEALASYDKAVALSPLHADFRYNRAIALFRVSRLEEAVKDYDKAIELGANTADTHNNRGSALVLLKRFEEAGASFEKALALSPQHSFAFGGLYDAAVGACDWPKLAALAPELEARVREKRGVFPPFLLMTGDFSPALQRECAQAYFRHCVPRTPASLWRGEVYAHEKIRMAYLSGDFRTHAVAALTAELFETHDRSRFEVTAISYGVDDGGELRKRLEKAFDRFEDVRVKSDAEIARLIRDLEIDIAIDLGGYTNGARPEILAHRPAPVQASYLGYPGTLGADFVDYIIADPTVLPFDQQPFYAEKIVHLPDCYMVSDSTRKIAGETPSRKEAGLPDEGFVFCSFNNTYKVTPAVFDIWTRLMKDKAGSVLWARADNESAKRNLRKEALARGVDPSRIIFAERVPIDQHYARHRLADLFLDTLPYNAHTTASDALWAGLPVLTCLGDRFQGRVAASLLKAIGLPELVTTSLQDYEALARKLMNDPALLKAYRDRLAANRLTTPLFNTKRFTRNLETAYIRMLEQRRSGEPPRGFAVTS